MMLPCIRKCLSLNLKLNSGECYELIQLVVDSRKELLTPLNMWFGVFHSYYHVLNCVICSIGICQQQEEFPAQQPASESSKLC